METTGTLKYIGGPMDGRVEPYTWRDMPGVGEKFFVHQPDEDNHLIYRLTSEGEATYVDKVEGYGWNESALLAYLRD